MLKQIPLTFKNTQTTLKNLRARYRRLTFWNKIGFWGSTTGIISFLIYLITLFIPQETPLPIDIDAIISKLETTHKERFTTLEQQYQQQIEEWKQQAQNAVIALKNIRDQPDAPPGINEALAFLEKGNTMAAETIFQKLEERKTAEGKAANEEAATAARHLGALAFLHDTQKALNAYRRATQLDPDNEQGWNQLGHLLQRTGQLKDAEAAYQRVLALGEKRNDQSWIANAYTNLGILYQIRGELEQAEAMYCKSLILEEALGRQEGMARAYTGLGSLYYTRGELEQAEAMYHKSLVLNEALGHKAGMAHNYTGLGIVYETHGELEQAEVMYHKSLVLNEALGRKAGMASVYGNLGSLYYTRGELEQAKTTYQKALTLFQEVGAEPQIKQTQRLLEALR